jgi:2'-5' RNA ligase
MRYTWPVIDIKNELLIVFYPEVYASFLAAQYTLAAKQRNFPEWHKGRQRYYVWCIDVDSSEVLDRFIAAKHQYSHFIVQPYERQAHVTIAAAGFLVPNSLYNDDISIQYIEQKMARIKSARLSPFTLKVGGVNSFQSALFLEVMDSENGLQKLRQLILEDKMDFRSADYVPHITLGVYNNMYAVSEVHASPFVPMPALDQLVRSIGLYSYDAGDIGSKLTLEDVMFL